MATMLVTGGAGHVGSHVHDPLKEAGHQPVVFDNLSRGFAQLIEPHQQPLVVGHLADRARVRSVIDQYQINTILHFAALACVGESSEHPDRYYRMKTADAFGLLEEAIAYRPLSPLAFVLSSTCAVFGMPPSQPIDDLNPRTPINPYDRSKLALEWMIADLAQRYRFPTMFLRYLNAAAAEPESICGECHNSETHLIPLAIQAALDGTPYVIHRDDFDTPDGCAIRDLIHMGDLASAHIGALDYLITGLERPLAVGV
jgi:UDP-glucose-4-epimerase GalE